MKIFKMLFCLAFFGVQDLPARTTLCIQDYQYRLVMNGDNTRYYVSDYVILKMATDGSMQNVGHIWGSESPDFWGKVVLNNQTYFIKQDATTVCTYSGSVIGKLTPFGAGDTTTPHSSSESSESDDVRSWRWHRFNPDLY